MSPKPAAPAPAAPAPRRFRGIRRKISAFLLTAVLGFVGVVALVAYKQGVFVPHTNVFFYAADASGINKGMPVRLYGVPVGTVKDIELADRGGVRVRLGIATDYLSRMPRGAQARFVREGVVGAASIQIVTSATTRDQTPVAEGDVIRYIPQRSMNEMVDELRQQMAPAFQELRKVAADIGDPEGDFRRSLTSLREVIAELPGASRELRQLLRDTDRTMVSVGRQAEAVGGVVTRVGAHTEEQLPILAGKLASTLDSLHATSEQLRHTTRENGDALRELLTQAPELMRGGNELVRDSQELTAAARRTWLLRDYVETPEMRTLPVDSFESFGKR